MRKMKNQMSNSRLKLGLIVAILVVVGLIASFGAVILVQQHLSFLERNVTSPSYIRGDIEFFYVTNAIINSINIALLVILIVIYGNIYNKTRSPFTIGLVIFALAFLIRDLFANPFLISIYGFRAYGLGPFAFLPSLFELVALSVLLYLSARY